MASAVASGGAGRAGSNRTHHERFPRGCGGRRATRPRKRRRRAPAIEQDARTCRMDASHRNRLGPPPGRRRGCPGGAADRQSDPNAAHSVILTPFGPILHNGPGGERHESPPVPAGAPDRRDRRPARVPDRRARAVVRHDQDDDPRQPGRRLGPDGPRARRRDAVGQGRAVGQFDNKGGAAGTIGLAQFVNSAEGRPERAADGRHGDGRRHRAAKVAGQPHDGHADRAPDQRVPRRRRAGELAVQDDGRPRRRVQGRPGQGVVARRLGRRLRPHPRGPDRAGGRRRPGQGQLRARRRAAATRSRTSSAAT